MTYARTRRALHRAVVWACIASVAAPLGGLPQLRAAPQSRLEPALIPTVNPTLLPASAIQTPLKLGADRTMVWRPGLEQRLYLEGNVVVEVGYRVLKAPKAVAWLTPSSESGAGVYDVAVYLSSGDGKDAVEVVESTAVGGTVSVSKELLVTTRVTQSALLTGTPTPMPREAYTKFEKEDATYTRGEGLRQDLLTKRPPPAYIPTIVFTDAAAALQRGWIARGAGNVLIAGPADTAIARGGPGSGATTQERTQGVGPKALPKEKQRPPVLAVVDRASSYLLPNGKEQVTVVNNLYLMVGSRSERPPVELKAENAVFFSPAEALKGAMAGSETQPATAPAPGTAPAKTAATPPGVPAGLKPLAGLDTAQIQKYATGVYLEGDVTLVAGNTTVRAARMYYDFTSDRAIMLDATLSTVEEQRNVPVYMRAAEIRQLSQTEFVAKDVKFSTSEFYTPHYHIGASNMYLQEVPAGMGAGTEGMPGLGGRSFDVGATDVTFNVQGVPIFGWPAVAGNTDRELIPLRKIKVSNSRRYGPSLETQWDLLALAGQASPKGTSVTLQLDYFGKRGPGAGVDAKYEFEGAYGQFKSYGIYDTGTDRLGRDAARQDLPPEQPARGRVVERHKQVLDENWTVDLEFSYITDPNFLENFFESEFDTDKEHETSFYLKRQGETDALTFYGKWSLYDFTSVADLVDDQFTTEKKPEIKYFRIGDSILDVFTYYSETSVANVNSMITNYSPSFSGLQNLFAQDYFAAYGHDLSKLSTVTLRDFYRQNGWSTQSVLRGDTRQELDLPLNAGDVKITPYVTGRFTYWDDAFPAGEPGNTTRLYGGGGVRMATQFWRTYDETESKFLDVHRLRHLIEPNFNLLAVGADQNRADLQPFDRDVEGISTASGFNLGLNQKWQTKRGGPDHWRTTDWITLNVNWSYFFNKDDRGRFFAEPPLRGYFFKSRPELSQVENAVNVDGSWRIGERVRFLSDANFNTDAGRVQQAAAGFAIDHSPYLSYFVGDRYITSLDTYRPFSEGGNFAANKIGAQTTNEITFGFDYQVTRKYEIIFTESFDTGISQNILTSLTLVRRFPRLNTALTISYDANQSDTSVVFVMWPEGFDELGPGNNQLKGR